MGIPVYVYYWVVKGKQEVQRQHPSGDRQFCQSTFHANQRDEGTNILADAINNLSSHLSHGVRAADGARERADRGEQFAVHVFTFCREPRSQEQQDPFWGASANTNIPRSMHDVLTSIE
jgi:hypothetical protein